MGLFFGEESSPDMNPPRSGSGLESGLESGVESGSESESGSWFISGTVSISSSKTVSVFSISASCAETANGDIRNRILAINAAINTMPSVLTANTEFFCNSSSFMFSLSFPSGFLRPFHIHGHREYGYLFRYDWKEGWFYRQLLVPEEALGSLLRHVYPVR